MVYHRHDFRKNYLNFIKTGEFPLALDMLTNEIADWITVDTTDFCDTLKACNVTPKSDKVKDIVDAFLANLQDNTALQNKIVNHFVKGKNDTDFGKALANGVSAIIGSHYNPEKGQQDLYDTLKDKIKNFNKRNGLTADASTADDNMEPATKSKGLTITKEVVIKAIVLGLAIYGTYHLYLFVKSRVRIGAPQMAAGGSMPPQMPQPPQQIIVQAPPAVAAPPVQPQVTL